MPVREPNAVSGEPIEIRRLRVCGTKARDIANAQIVGNDHDDVRSSRGLLPSCGPGGSETARPLASSDAHHRTHARDQPEGCTHPGCGVELTITSARVCKAIHFFIRSSVQKFTSGHYPTVFQ